MGTCTKGVSEIFENKNHPNNWTFFGLISWFYPFVPLCVGHKLVTLAELLFTKGALVPTRFLVDPLVDSSNLPIKELLSTSAALVLSLPAVTNHVAFQGGLRAALFSTGWAKFLRLVSIVVSHLVVDHGRPGVEHLLTLVTLNILGTSVQEGVRL